MLDKKKLAIIITVAIVVLAALIIGIIWVSTNAGRATTATPNSSPTSSTLSPAATATLTDPQRATVITAAVAAAQFSGSDGKAQRDRNYAAAGFPEGLAASFQPVWLEVFNVPTVSKVKIAATGETLLGATINVQSTPTVSVTHVSGTPGHRTFEVAVDVACAPQWTLDGGSVRFGNEFTATWHVTLDEATGAVTNVEQPTRAQIPFQVDK